jgi:hypothetical protein
MNGKEEENGDTHDPIEREKGRTGTYMDASLVSRAGLNRSRENGDTHDPIDRPASGS